MKGFINKKLGAVWLAGGLTFAGGCETYRDVVDPCYPKRYEAQARKEATEAYAPQVNNGHVLDQTIWNYHFEAGTDKLTPGGLERLAYLARRRPSPDPFVYVQTAQDVSFDPGAADKFAEQRSKLDNGRVQAVQSYLNAETAGRHITFEVAVHDPAEVGLSGAAMNTSIQKLQAGFVGILPAAAGGGGGAAAPAK
jgi:hypothetical protein